MDERTREYLRGRFRDYYRSGEPSLPPAANRREWGHIPWTSGTGTTMVRHQSLFDLGNVESFLTETGPRHVYFSAARYENPGASKMSAKDWVNADLVFDLDADHLPGVDPDETSYAAMLMACKDALVRLLDFLETDFAFEDVTVVFSGGRGYHVHVRDEEVRNLGSDARREIVDYVRGIDLDYDALTATVSVEGTNQRMLRTGGGWGRRVHAALLEYAADLREADDDAAKEQLTSLDGIGESRATTILGAIRRNPEALQAGNLEAGGPGLRRLVQALTAQVTSTQSAPIDEPVTTDTRRLIRLPHSLHGGTGLVVRRIPRDELDGFSPLTDAVAERFQGREIEVNLDTESTVALGGDKLKMEPGPRTVAEPVGILLMARGDASKTQER